MILVITGCAVSCESWYKSGYKTFAFKEDDVRITDIGGVILEHPLFTFEYPCGFGLVDINRFPDLVYNPNVTEVEFTRDFEGIAGPYESIDVWVHKPETYLWEDTNAKEAVDNTIASDSGNPDYQNFQVLERTTVSVAGITAEYVAYSYYRPAKEGLGYDPYNRVVRFVAFDHEGFVWKLKLDCFAESAEETKPYFEHLIETFQILE